MEYVYCLVYAIKNLGNYLPGFGAFFQRKLGVVAEFLAMLGTQAG
jgi:hypothetical protein